MVEMELVISSKFKQLLPALSEEEAKQLEANIVSDGRVRDPILYWHHGGKNLVVDGMNRYGIAKKTGKPYRTEPITFDSFDEAELWILNNALGRRNLMKPHEVRKVRGELYNRLKGGRGGANNQHPPEVPKGQNVPLKKTAAQQVAEKSGVDEKTIKRDGKRVEIIESLPKTIQNAINEDRLPVSDEQLKALAKLEADKQIAVARDVRTGSKVDAALEAAGAPVKAKKTKCEHSWVNDGNGERYCEHCKEDHPENKPKTKSGKEKISAAKLVDEVTRKHVGYCVRGIDAIALANGGKGPIFKEANEAINTFIGCLKKMRAGEK